MNVLALIALLLSAAFIDAKSLAKDEPKDVAKNDKNENADFNPPLTSQLPDATTPGVTTVGATTPDATTPDATTPDATTPGATSAGATTAGATSDVPADAFDDVVVGRVKRHRPSWRRRSYWRNRWHRNQWWSNRWSTWSGWYDSNVWNNYDWSHVSWDDHDRDHYDHDRYYHGRHYRSAPNEASENQEKNNDQDTTDKSKTTDKATTPTLPVNITAPVTDLPTTPTTPATLPVNITTSDTNPPATGSHDDDVGRDKRYFFIYPTWSRRAYWRTRLMSSRWWSPWWASWDGWYDIGVWDAYNWAGLDWWGDFYYSIGGRYYRSASNAVGFQLIEEAKTWAEAAEFCAMKRMCLATLSTEEQKDAAADISSDTSYWIGGHLDTSITPVGWRWINGQPVSEAPLVKIDPTVPLRLCLVGERGFHLAGRCDQVKPFLCQSRC